MGTERLRGKRALITGAATGIGRAIAVRFAREGADVGINYIGAPEKAEETRALAAAARPFAGRQEIFVADVSKEEQVSAMFAGFLDTFGGIDILVNNAGIVLAGDSHEMPLEVFDQVTGVNLRGPFLCARAALGAFLRQGEGGVILNTSSVHQSIPKPKYVSYAISKSGMDGFTRTLALEYADRGIRVNAVAPGAILTPMNDAWRDDASARAGVESHIPMGRAGDPDEIASVFAFLASPDASYITGQTIYACGGLSLYPEFRDDWSTGR